MKKAESYKPGIIPAMYKLADQWVLVSDISQKLIVIPVQCETVTECILVIKEAFEKLINVPGTISKKELCSKKHIPSGRRGVDHLVIE